MTPPFELISAYLDNELDAEGISQLRRWLKEDPSHIKLFIRESYVHQRMRESFYSESQQRLMKEDSGLQEFDEQAEMEDRNHRASILAEVLEQERVARIKREAEESLAKQQQADSDAERRESMRRLAGLSKPENQSETRHYVIPKPLFYGSIAAVIAIAAAIIWPMIQPKIQQAPEQPVAEGPLTPEGPKFLQVATIVEEVDAVWEGGTHEMAVDNPVYNEPIALVNGLARLRFNNGAEVLVEAPAELEPLGDDRVKLTAGKIVGLCPTKESRGFTVISPSGAITDLGTEFGVDVKDDKTTDVQVFSGEVEATLNDESGNVLQTASLTNGWAARLAADQKKIRLGRARLDDFVRDTSTRRRHQRIIMDDFETTDSRQPGGFDKTAGTGWVGPWHTRTSGSVSVVITNESNDPLGWDSENYIDVSLRNGNGMAAAMLVRQYDWYRSVERNKPHRIRFLVRVDDAIGASKQFNDRVSVFDDVATRVGSSGSNSWLLSAFGNPNEADLSGGGEGELNIASWSWSFYDGDAMADGNVPADYSRFVDTSVGIVPGRSYEFEITVDPENLQWDLVIVHGKQRYSSRETLGRSILFRTSAKGTGGFLHFGLSSDRPNVKAGMQIDDVRIEPLE